MIPMLIQQGFAVIAVAFDVWSLAGLTHDAMKAARAITEKVDEPEVKDEKEEDNGTAEVGNGKKEEEDGTTEVVIGKGPPS